MPTTHAKAGTARDDAADTVIVAESDVFARMVLAEYLRECGYEVLEATTSEDVLVLFRSGHEVDILLLNAKISGGLGGFVLTRQIRDSYPGTEIVLSFGVARAADKAGELCDDGPLDRPYHPQEIVSRIKRLRQKRAPKP